jgi:sugar lactone lactonase YvrE
VLHYVIQRTWHIKLYVHQCYQRQRVRNENEEFLIFVFHLLAPTPIVPDDGICASATWNTNGITVAGGNGEGPGLDQLYKPEGLFVDDDSVVYVADTWNNRVVKWAPGVSSGQVMVEGDRRDKQTKQAHFVTKVIFDKNETMFICDSGNSRVDRWFKSDKQGQTIIENIACFGLAMDNKGSLYITDYTNQQVTKWPGDQIVAGGNGEGADLNQFWEPFHIFVDQAQSVFVTDWGNNRVMKWPIDAKEGIVVAGGHGPGDNTNQFSAATSVVVDQMGTLYVADNENHRIMRWLEGSRSGSVIIGGQGEGNGTAQLSFPYDLTFDRQGNLYVADYGNHRIQMFAIDKSACSQSTRQKIVIN